MNRESTIPQQIPYFIYFKRYSEFVTSKNILYQKLDNKIDLFEKCLNEVGLYKSFPFIDITRFRIFRTILPESFRKYPTDQSEEILMRNCVKREIMKNTKIQNYIFHKK